MESMKKLVGNQNTYIKIASRGEDELYLSMQYVIHPVLNMGGLLTRFIARATPNSFKHFKAREITDLKNEEGISYSITRLNKVVIPVVKPGPSPFAFLTYCDKSLLWEITAEWVMERCKADGFTLDNQEEFPTVLRDLVAGKFEIEKDEELTLILEFPSLEGVEKES